VLKYGQIIEITTFLCLKSKHIRFFDVAYYPISITIFECNANYQYMPI
jgi:hypothetical protein